MQNKVHEDTASWITILSLGLLLISAGLVHACLVTYAELSLFFSSAVHGTLLALLGANLWAMQKDLEQQRSPLERLERTERMQMELITHLTLNNMTLQSQNKVLKSKLGLRDSYKHPRSRSWNDIPDNNTGPT